MKLSFVLWGGLLTTSVSAFQPRTVARASLQPLAALVDIQENANRDLQGMDEWANACGVQRAEGLQPATEDGNDFYIMTGQDIPANSPVMVVPNNVILSSSRARQEFGNNVDAAIDQLTRLGAGDQVPQFLLFLKVLAEYEKGDQSPWFAWLNSLPRLFYNSVAMTDFCIELLPPYVFSLSRLERLKFENYCAALKEVDFLSDFTKNNKAFCKWAFNVVTTRSWGPENDKQIVPIADMFNHGTETEVTINYDDEGNCNVYTTRDVSAGSPLRMSYGDPTNPSRLLATYGFLDESSPATFCKIMIQPTEQLKEMGYDHSRMLFYQDTGDISQEVWDVMLYQNLGGSNRDAQQALYQAHMTGDTDTKQNFHQHYFLETATSLQKHVDTFLNQLDELSAKLVGKDVNEHPRLPLIMAHNEFVKNTFLTVKARLDPMVAQAGGEPF